MKRIIFSLLIFLSIFLFILYPTPSIGAEVINRQHPGTTDADPHIVTYVGVETEFKGIAISPDSEIMKYEWDFDGDGISDYESSITGFAVYIFKKAGNYNAVFKAYDDSGAELPSSITSVEVREGKGQQEIIPKRHFHQSDNYKTMNSDAIESDVTAEGQSVFSSSNLNAGDGFKRRYIMLIHGTSSSRYWEDAVYAYDMFHVTYNIPEEDIYFLNYDGTTGFDGTNPNGIIDYAATKSNLQMVCNTIANSADPDDIVVIWIVGDGSGYFGPVQRYASQSYLYGYLGGVASVDPGDEQDYLESEFKLRSLFIGGYYHGNHGMDVWKVYYHTKNSNETYYYRNKYVSHFDNIYFEQGGVNSDNDIYIERFIDYLEGDYDKNGIINTTLGEVMDYDNDGIPPYDPNTGEFDLDDWGEIDLYYDDYNNINTGVPEGFETTYKILDINLDNRLDIDLNHDPANPEANGTDFDNEGLFDGLDVNDDKDKNDWVSIDETVMMLYGSDTFSDDELKNFLEPINAHAVVIAMNTCFSGGFVEDLSMPGRIIITASEEETQSFTSRFIQNLTSALSGLMYPQSTGDPSLADVNQDGHIDMTEVFNFASANDWGPTVQIPQYDDNGDKVSHSYPLPNEGDGDFGTTVYLDNPPDETPPVTPLVSDEEDFTANTGELYASWISEDSESGVYEYQYIITEDSIVGTIIRNWTSTGITNQVLAETLNLTNGKTYYFGVKARNGVGLWSDIGYSDGITVDNTSPSTPDVTDEGKFTKSRTELSASWSSSDTESGIVEYQYRITEQSINGTVIRDWTSNGTDTSVTATGLPLQKAKIYYFSVKAKNGAGLWSEAGYSDGIRVK